MMRDDERWQWTVFYVQVKIRYWIGVEDSPAFAWSNLNILQGVKPLEDPHAIHAIHAIHAVGVRNTYKYYLEPKGLCYSAPSSWRQWSNHTSTTRWRRHGQDMVTTWQRSDNNMAMKWRQHRDDTTTTWRHDDDVTTTWRRCHVAATSPPHIAATSPPHRRHIAATLLPHCRHIAAILPPHWLPQVPQDLISANKVLFVMLSPCHRNVVAMSAPPLPIRPVTDPPVPTRNLCPQAYRIYLI